MPSTRRLRPALLLIGAGLALAALQSLASTRQADFHAGTLALSCGLAVLAVATIITSQDLQGTQHNTAQQR